jgi:hypothetical protein
MPRVFDVIRAREWKASKLNPLFAGLLLALLTTSEFSLCGLSIIEDGATKSLVLGLSNNICHLSWSGVVEEHNWGV